MKKDKGVRVAIVLSGCGYLDGSEIQETILTLLALDQVGAMYTLFAPDLIQKETINHFTGGDTHDSRNVFTESARLARGKLRELSHLNIHEFDALVLPGGYGIVKNLSNLYAFPEPVVVYPPLEQLIVQAWQAKKVIGAMCIAPALVVAALKGHCVPQVTVGEDTDQLISKLGGKHVPCATNLVTIDRENKIVSTPAYMRSNERIAIVSIGIELLVRTMLTIKQ